MGLFGSGDGQFRARHLVRRMAAQPDRMTNEETQRSTRIPDPRRNPGISAHSETNRLPHESNKGMPDAKPRRSERAITDDRSPDELIQCCGCGKYEPLGQRSRYWSHSDGQYAFKYRYFRNLCRECNRVRAKAYRDTHRFCGGCRRYRPESVFPEIRARGVRCHDCIEKARAQTLTTTEKVERKLAALEDLEYAESTLGMSRHRAIEWIANGYGVGTSAVERWIRDRDK